VPLKGVSGLVTAAGDQRKRDSAGVEVVNAERRGIQLPWMMMRIEDRLLEFALLRIDIEVKDVV
jgi:hypothetical protein